MEFHPVDNQSFLLDPTDTLEYMRIHHPVYRYDDAAVPIVNVFGYHDIRTILRDVETFSNTVSRKQQDKVFTDPYNLLGMDPPGHKRMREVVSKVFTPGMIRSLEPAMRKHCHSIMDHVLELETFDAVEDFGAELSVHMICRLIGVPEEDKPLMREWTNLATKLGFDLLWHKDRDHEHENSIEAQMTLMHDYFQAKIDDRLINPRKDIITEIAHSGLTRQECVSFARLLLVAGNETTANLINHTINLLVRFPEQQKVLR